MGLGGWLIDLSWPFYIGLFGAATQAVWQVKQLIPDSPNDCLAKFRSNRLFSWLFLSGIIMSQIIYN
jgi:4-hydroxybenzoate polyprenyltransferase